MYTNCSIYLFLKGPILPPVLNKPAIATTAAAAAAAANTSMPTYGVSKIIYSLSLEKLRYIFIYIYIYILICE